MAQRPDSQVFSKLKTFYPWLGDDQLALLQGVYHTWRQLADANRMNLFHMLEGIPRPPDIPGITLDQLEIIQAFASEQATLQGQETT
jgi:hypothetical protein